MARTIFVNLAVQDLARSRDFFAALGFSFNEEYSDDKAACVVIDDNIFAMLLTEEFFATFINGGIADTSSVNEALLCLSCASRAQGDGTYDTAIAAGGKPWKPAIEQGPMYVRSFADPDGHVWELLHMGAH